MPRSWRTPRRWRSAPSSPGVGREVHALPGKGRGPAPRPQLGLLPAVLSLLLPAPGRARDRGRAHVRARGAPPGCGLGREGQPRPLGRARRAGLRHDRALPLARHRDVLGALARQGRPVRRATRPPAARGRARGRGGGPRHPRRRRGDAPPAVLRLRDHEAPLLRRRRARGRLRRAGDGPQPGRRGGAAHGQRAPLADGPPRAPAAGAAADPSQVRAQGEAALPDERVRDGGLRLHARHRLHRRRVSERRGRVPAPLQGRAQPARSGEPRHQAGLREGVPAYRTARLRPDRAGRAEPVRGLRHAGVRLALRLLPPGARGAGEGIPRGRGRARVSAAPERAAVGERATLRAEEAVVLIDRKERTYLRVLRPGRSISVRGAPLPCDALIGLAEGSTVETTAGEPLIVLRPTYAQLIPNLPRRAQPIYPKDVGPILLWGHIGPGDHVVEVGTGPGALTIALLRAVGPTGRLVSYEVRLDFAQMASENVTRYHGEAANWTLRTADAFEGLLERDVDRLVIDLAEPWRFLPVAAPALRPGAVLTSFLPTVLQVKELVDGLRAHGGFGCVETLETLARFWHVRDRSVRPTHRMVAHTGFLVFARRLAGNSELTRPEPCSTDER